MLEHGKNRLIPDVPLGGVVMLFGAKQAHGLHWKDILILSLIHTHTQTHSWEGEGGWVLRQRMKSGRSRRMWSHDYSSYGHSSVSFNTDEQCHPLPANTIIPLWWPPPLGPLLTPPARPPLPRFLPSDHSARVPHHNWLMTPYQYLAVVTSFQ